MQVTGSRRRNGKTHVEGPVEVALQKAPVGNGHGSHSKVVPAEEPVQKGGEGKVCGWRQDGFLFAGLITLMGIITYVTMPDSLTVKNPTVLHVWFYGWLAAITTGLGALPLLFFSKPSDFWLGASNAIAAGMMLSASYSLITEGMALDDDGAKLFGHAVSHAVRVGTGVLLGMLFVRCTKSYVEAHEDLKLGGVSGMEAAKIFLIIAVMTLHSFAEGLLRLPRPPTPDPRPLHSPPTLSPSP